jgi:large subunit ribosomal protein L5
MAEKKEKSKEAKGDQKKPAAKAASKAKAAVPAAKKETAAAPKETVKAPTPRLKERYQKDVVPALMKQFSYRNPMQVPRLVKVVLNMGMGEAITNAKALDHAVDELKRISGQQPVITRAKKSIATFKLREGVAIGTTVTLRRERMFEFLDRLISAALPRIRDFRGIPTRSFDGRGNYSLGIKEQVIFPEIEIDKVDTVHGLDVTIVTTAKTDEEGRALLGHLGMPFRK